MHTNYRKWEAIMREATDSSSLEFPLAHQTRASVQRGRGGLPSLPPVYGVLACDLGHTYPPRGYSFWLMNRPPTPFTKSLCDAVSPVTIHFPISAKSGELMLAKAELIFSSTASSKGSPFSQTWIRFNETKLTNQRMPGLQPTGCSCLSAPCQRGETKTQCSE